MNYLLNYRKMVSDLLPPILRKNKMSAWIRVFSTVFSNHNSRQGLDGFFRFDRLSSNEEKALAKLNTIFLAPLSLADKKTILADAINTDGSDGITLALVDELLEIGGTVGQLEGLRNLSDPFTIDDSLVTIIEEKLALADLKAIFDEFGSTFMTNNPDFEFDVSSYVQDVQNLSFERFRREQLYNVYLTGQTIVLETHLNTIYGLAHLKNDLGQPDTSQMFKIENVGEFKHTFFHQEEKIFPPRDLPLPLNEIDEIIKDPRASEIESFIIYDQNEAVDTGSIVEALGTELLISGIIAGDVSKGFPQAIEVYAVEEVDLNLYSLRVYQPVRNIDGVVTNIEEIEIPLPGTTLEADKHFMIIPNVHKINDTDSVTIDQEVYEFYFEVPFTDATAFKGPTSFNLDEGSAIELYRGTELVDKFGEADEVGSESLWDYTGSWYYRDGVDGLKNAIAATDGPLPPDFLFKDWRFGGTSPFVTQDIFPSVDFATMTNVVQDRQARRPFLETSFDIGNLENQSEEQFIGFKTESNQGAGFDFKIICPDFTPENRPYENTAAGVREFLFNVVTEVNKFRLAGKFFIIEAEGNKVLSDGSLGRIFDETFETSFE